MNEMGAQKNKMSAASLTHLLTDAAGSLHEVSLELDAPGRSESFAVNGLAQWHAARLTAAHGLAPAQASAVRAVALAALARSATDRIAAGGRQVIMSSAPPSGALRKSAADIHREKGA